MWEICLIKQNNRFNKLITSCSLSIGGVFALWAKSCEFETHIELNFNKTFITFIVEISIVTQLTGF